MRPLLLLTAAASLLGALCPPARAAAPIILAEQGDATGQTLGKLLQRQLAGKVKLRWVTYSADSLGNPIYKGQVMASLSAAPLVVPIGDDATLLALAELEEMPVYFVGASAVAGADLSQRRVSGVLNYSPSDLLSALPAAWRRRLGVLYTAGYEPVLEAIRAAAKEQDVHIVARKIADRRDLPSGARTIMSDAKAVWVLGDPLLVRGAGLEHLVESSLAAGVPLVGSGPWEVRRGATLCSYARREALAQEASKAIALFLEAGQIPRRVETGPSGGAILYHRGLGARFGLSPKPPVWVELQ